MRSLRAILPIAILAAAIVVQAQEFAPGQVLVKFKEGSDPAARLLAATVSSEVLGDVPALGVKVVAVPYGWNVPSLVRWLSKQPGVEYAEPDYIARAQVVPNDTYYNVQWGFPKIGAPTAWDRTRGAGVVVAVIDTGIEASHPDISGQVVSQRDFVDNDYVAQDGNGHGTHTGGTVAAKSNNALGVASMAWDAKIMAVRVLDNNGSGTYSAIANGITYAADNGAKVINMSLGGSAGSTTLQNAVVYAYNRGLTIVASAGNNGNTAPNYPAYYSQCIAVAATDQSDRRATFSTYGSWVDVAAPGVQIGSTYKGGQYVYMDGTSMAAPHVAGLAALLAAQGRSQADIRARILNGDPVSSRFGAYPTKRINAAKATL